MLNMFTCFGDQDMYPFCCCGFVMIIFIKKGTPVPENVIFWNFLAIRKMTLNRWAIKHKFALIKTKKIIMLTALSSLKALNAVILTAFNAFSDDIAISMTSYLFHHTSWNDYNALSQSLLCQCEINFQDCSLEIQPNLECKSINGSSNADNPVHNMCNFTQYPKTMIGMEPT